jgi:hypothetical protein
MIKEKLTCLYFDERVFLSLIARIFMPFRRYSRSISSKYNFMRKVMMRMQVSGKGMKI